MYRLQICPIVYNYRRHPQVPNQSPSYIRIRAVVSACGEGEIQTRVTSIHFASAICFTRNVITLSSCHVISPSRFGNNPAVKRFWCTIKPQNSILCILIITRRENRSRVLKNVLVTNMDKATWPTLNIGKISPKART